MLRVHISTALSSLSARKLRTFLAMLGVLVGTASVVALVSSGQLASRHAMAQFRALGTDLLAVSMSSRHKPVEGSKTDQLDLHKIGKLMEASSDILQIAPYIRLFSHVIYEGHNLPGNIVGVTAGMRDIAGMTMASGRFISDLDRRSYYCVIGHKIAVALKKIGMFNPLGKLLRVGEQYFEIIGVIEPWPENMFLFMDINNAVVVPITTAKHLQKEVVIHDILFRLHRRVSISKVQADITDKIKVLVASDKRLFFRSPKQIIERMKKQQQAFTWLLGLIGSIALLVGGIGIMNIMLASVMERKREIGIRLAIGARSCDIQGMFLLETVSLTLLGGFIGVLCGVTVSFTIARYLSATDIGNLYSTPCLSLTRILSVGYFFMRANIIHLYGFGFFVNDFPTTNIRWVPSF